MKKIIIVGAGGFGRELLQWIKDINKEKHKWEIKGFIDDNLQALDNKKCDYKVISTIRDWMPSVNEVFACAIANPEVKEKIVTLLKSKGAIFTSIIHPKASIGEFNNIGEGLIAYPNAIITVNVTIGNFVTLLSSEIGHDASIGDYSTISSYCDITGGVSIGKKTFLGSHVTIVPKRRIGDNVFIGAGSVVMTNSKDNNRLLGNPAKKMEF